MSETTLYSIFGWMVDGAIIAALIQGAATVIGGGLVAWVAATWQRRQFKEQRSLSWTDRQLDELYGPLLALVHCYAHEQNALLDALPNIYDKKFFSLTDTPATGIVITSYMPDEQKSKLEEAMAYHNRSNQISERLYKSIHALIMDNYELLEVSTRDRLPALYDALRLHQDYQNNVIDTKTLRQLKDTMDIDDNIHWLLADIDATTLMLIGKRCGTVPPRMQLRRSNTSDEDSSMQK